MGERADHPTRYNGGMDHDRLFKELLSTFFVEFVDLFLPDVGAT